MSKLIKCPACDDPFNWIDQVIEVDDKYYHQDCVNLYPTGYVAYLNDNCLGETENDDGTSAWDILKEGQYLDD